MGLKASDKECVGYLCVDRKCHREIVKEPIGTCFFVCFPSVACSDHQSLYLVTAKHVIENEPVVYVRINNKLTKKAEYHALNEEWHSLSTDESVDLAAMPWKFPYPNAEPDMVDAEGSAVTEDNFKKHHVRWPLEETEQIYYIGMIPEHFHYDQNLPIVKTGTVCLVTNQKLMGEYGFSSYFLIESQIYPVNSGSPVWFQCPTGQIIQGFESYLLGVLSSSHPAPEQEYWKKTKHGKEKFIGYFNMGVSFVVPAEKLLELLREMYEMNKTKKPEPPKPVPAGGRKGRYPEIQKKTFLKALGKVSRRKTASEFGQEKL